MISIPLLYSLNKFVVGVLNIGSYNISSKLSELDDETIMMGVINYINDIFNKLFADVLKI